MMVRVQRINDSVLLEASNEDGNIVKLDGAEAIGGVGGGFRPMQMVLAAIAGCTTMDLVTILKKQRQQLKDLQIEVTGERKSRGASNPFSKIHLHYLLSGELDQRKVAKAIELAVDKYCSVRDSLREDIAISYDFTIQ